jgi:hypothetical protein
MYWQLETINPKMYYLLLAKILVWLWLRRRSRATEKYGNLNKSVRSIIDLFCNFCSVHVSSFD